MKSINILGLKIYILNGNLIYEEYKNAYIELIRLKEELKDFPTVSQWNKYAQSYRLLSSQSIEYISRTKLESIKR